MQLITIKHLKKLSFLLILCLSYFSSYGQNQTVYWIERSDLVGISTTSACAASDFNSGVTSNAFGFDWTDTLNPGTTIIGVTIDFVIGTECGATTRPTSLNGIAQQGISTTPNCFCTVSASRPLLSPSIDELNYTPGGLNQFRITTASNTGFSSNNSNLVDGGQNYFAKITVTYGANDDAGIEAINLAPSFCAESKDISVELKNFGTNNITTADIQWEINGTPQTTFSYSGTLAPNASTTVVLASNFNFTNGTYVITARTNNPNNTTDGNTSNDELQRTINVGAFPPTNITHTEVTANSVYNVTWTGDNTQTYELEYGSFGFTIGSGTTISNITGTSQNISGINPSINGYDIYVRSYCGSTPSNWSQVYSFGVVPFFVSNEAELDAALTASVNEDVIAFLNDIVITSQKTISGKTITINGQGYELSVPRPGLDDMGRFNSSPSNFRVFQLSSTANVTINNLTLKGGVPNSNGGAILVNSGTTLNINNSVVSNTNAGATNGGGGIAVLGTMFMKNSFIRRNAARYGGGILVTGTGRAYVEESTMVENRSTSSNGGGGAAECQSGSILYFNNSTLSNNQSTEIGGAINNYNGTVYFINSSATGNVAFGSFEGGAIGNNGGNVYILNSLFAHNYRRTLGSVTDPTGYVLDDFERSPSGIRIYHSVYHATLPTGLAVNTGNVQYTGVANGSDNSIFSGGLLSKITDNDGNEIGDQVFRPFLFNNQGSVAPTLQVGSFVTQTANLGVPTRFSNNNNSNPTIAYFSGGTWTNLIGTSTSGQEVTNDQVGNTRSSSTPARGAIENELNATLYIIKVNGASGGTVNGGTIYGDVYPQGTQITLTAIADSGQQFSQWDYVDGGTGTASTANPYTFTVTQDATLVPVFSALSSGSYTITYIGNGNTGGTVPAGGTFTAATTISGANTLVKDGFDFTGWNTNSNGSGVAYSEGDTHSAGTNLSLYAQWTAKNIFQWNGNVDNDWNNGANWSEVNPPTSTDDVRISSAAPNMPSPSTNVEINSLDIQTNATLIINPTLTLKIAGDITNNGQIIFKSDVTGSGMFDQFTGTISGNGTVQVERFIPAQRAFRFLSPSVTTTTSIRNNWQENGGAASGLGTHITGTGGTADGFDVTGTNNPSMFTFSNGSWVPVTSTLGVLTSGTPYRLMVRGDRTTDLTSNTPTPSVTTLRATGALHTGNFTPVLNQTAEGFSFIGNPYQAPINIKTALDAASSSMNTGQLFYWDPTLNTRGGYVTRTLSETAVNNVTSSFTEVLQPGQAIFVKKDNTSTAPSLTISETHKVVSQGAAGAFRNAVQNNSVGLIRANLQANWNNQWQTTDAALAVFKDTYSWNVTEEDAVKIGNLDEEVSFVKANTALAITQQNSAALTDELPIRLNQLRHTNYRWYFDLTHYNGYDPYLVDIESNTITAIDDATVIPFTVGADATNRFKIVFQNNTLSTPDVENPIVVYPNPSTGGELYIKGVTGDVSVAIHNLLGQNIPATLNSRNGLVEVTTNTTLSKGVYLVSVTSEGITQQVKWMVK